MKRLVLLLLLVVACSRQVDRERWTHMSHDEKTLYVRSILGHEKAKERKGGHAVVYGLPAEEYVRRIDAAYARGDGRAVERVFATLTSDR